MELTLNNQMKIIDETAISNYDIPGVILMENAGNVAVEEIIKEDFKNVSILCGMGNNGGDGLVIARKLHLLGKKVRVFIIGSANEINGDSGANLNIVKKLGIQIDEVKNINGIGILEKSFKEETLVVDAIYGTGLNRDIEGIDLNAIRVVNNNANRVISIDIPSGISGNTALPMGIAIKASKTICLELPKIGNIMYPGADYNGELVIKKIGIPEICYKDANIEYFLIQEDMILDIVPRRSKNSHKGDFGKANIIAGSTGMTGAAILTSKAAMKTGLGLLKLYIPDSLVLLVTSSIPEVVTVPLQEVRKGVMGINTFNKIIEDAKESDGVAIGPGCGSNFEIGELLKRLIQESTAPIVIDADGINALAKNLSMLESKKSEIIVTPHPGEMARLIDTDISEIIKNPIDTAIAFSKK
jgi:NAD(P)H-hydrate epimerase